jgi:hypothetical protein
MLGLQPRKLNFKDGIPLEAQVPSMALSPPRKRIRYAEPRSITRLR